MQLRFRTLHEILQKTAFFTYITKDTLSTHKILPTPP